MVYAAPAVTPGDWIPALLAAFSHAGTAFTIGLVLVTGVLATRCKGCCRVDEVFRHHVV